MFPPLLFKAYALAQNNPYPLRAKLAALLVERRAVLGIGFNSNKTHPRMKSPSSEYPNCLHAEVDAILNAQRRGYSMHNTTLFIARVKRPHSNSRAYIMGLARPCWRCREIIYESGIRTITYTTDSGFATELLL